METDFTLPLLPPPPEIETREILKQLTLSHRHLAELKGVVKTIPNEQILINTLSLKEKKYNVEKTPFLATYGITWKKNAVFFHIKLLIETKRHFCINDNLKNNVIHRITRK